MGESVENMAVTVGSVIFSSPDNGFCIFRATSKSEKRGVPGVEFIAKGYIGAVQKDDEVLIWGEWERHPKFGSQVKITKYQMPGMEEKGVYAFLQSGFIKGVGPVLAKSIWETFGENTAKIMDEQPQKLLEVNGIGRSKLNKIVESWEENRSKQKALVKFQEWGIGPMTIQKILKKWPESPLETVEANPYLLAWEIDGVGFVTADKIARAAGVSEDSHDRISAGIHYVLQEASLKEGHCFLRIPDLIESAGGVLWPNTKEIGADRQERIKGCIAELVKEKKLISEDSRIYTPALHRAENSLAEHLLRLKGAVEPCSFSVSDAVRRYEQGHGITFDLKQKVAVKSAIDSKVCVITGGPGTGKTTIVNAILALAKIGGMSKVGLVAPTGRAAKRLHESTGVEAHTIHRYLGFHPSEGFVHHAKNPVKAELVICDEASMLDVRLAKALVSALPDRARLVLVGDIHQLPSVGAGNVLRDVIASNVFSVTELSTIHRQGEGSWITHNAHAIKNGSMSGINLSNKTNDFFFTDIEKLYPSLSSYERSEKLRERILMAVQKLITEKGYKPGDIQVLSPMYKGPVGIVELNRELQQMLNAAHPQKKEAKIGFKILREGDRVMQLKNNYKKEVFNGDQGWITEINNEDGNIMVQFNGEKIKYEFLDADELALAYACSVHKSQGSEFKAVVTPVTTGHFIMLQRNLIYTAVTRAKEICVLMGEIKALGISVKNNKPINRNTALKSLLKPDRAFDSSFAVSLDEMVGDSVGF